MLLDRINQSVKKMKQMDVVKNAALNAEKKAKDEADFKTVVGDFFNTVNKLHQAVTTMDFTVTTETVQSLEDSIDKLDHVVSAGVVDVESLSIARQQINRKVNSNLIKEWKAYHQTKTKSSISKLNTLGNLAGNPDTIATIRANISNGSEWAGLSLSDDGAHTRMALLRSAIDQIDELEESLNLNDEIKTFIVKVTSGKARITDMTPAIVEWIKKENLDDKFTINFRSYTHGR